MAEQAPPIRAFNKFIATPSGILRTGFQDRYTPPCDQEAAIKNSAQSFLERWIEDNVDGDEDPIIDDSRAEELARQLVVAAELQGISRRAMEDVAGNLVDRMWRALEEPAVPQVYILARNDN